MLLLSAGAALVAAAILCLTGWIAWDMRERAFRDTAGTIEKIDLVLAEQTTRMLESIDTVLTELIRDIEGRGFSESGALSETTTKLPFFHELRQRVSGIQQLDAIALIDRHGNVLNTTRTFPPINVDVSDRDYFRALADDPSLARFVSAPVQSRVTGEWTIYLARRIKAPDQSFVGVVIAAIALSSFEDFYKQIYLGDEVGVSLWRGDTTLLARFPQASTVIGKPSVEARQRIFETLLGDGREWGTARVQGTVNPVPLLVTARHVPNFPLYTTISVPERAILEKWRRASLPLIVGGALISIAIGVIAWLLLQHFATERRAADARLQRDEATAALIEAQALSRAKSEFLAHMSHELRTPLNAIIGFAEIMRDEMMGKLGAPQYKGYAQDIYQSGRNLLGIVNDVLDFTQANAGRLSVNRAAVNVAEIIASVSSMFRLTVAKAELVYGTEIEEGLPPALGDEKRIKQVLVNLVGNAIKFTPANGAVRVIARAVGGEIEIRVEDTGIGLTPENLAKVFEPFGFVDLPQVAQRNRGAGLGLPICKQLVELLGGTLTLESQIDNGTVAIVRLPAAPRPMIAVAA